jgi:hypothetical protein
MGCLGADMAVARSGARIAAAFLGPQPARRVVREGVDSGSAGEVDLDAILVEAERHAAG